MCSGTSSRGEGDEAEREQREVAHQRHGREPTAARVSPERGRAVPPVDGPLRPRLVPARPARARPSVAHRRAPRVRPGGARLRARPAAAATAGRFPSANRAWFLLESLRELRAALRERGGELFVREGRPERRAARAGRARPARTRCTSPPTCRRSRWRATGASRPRWRGGVEVRAIPGNFVADVGAPRTTDGRPFTVFSPFWRRWEKLPRREVHGAPRALARAVRAARRRDPARGAGGRRAVPAGRGGRARAAAALARRAGRRLPRAPRPPGRRHVRALARTLHFGCLSAREAEERARRARRARARAAFVRQLAWRDFYAHVLLNHPGNARHAHKARVRRR